MLTYGQKTSQDVSCMTSWDETVLCGLNRSWSKMDNRNK